MPGITNSIQSYGERKVKGLHKKKNKAVTICRKCENVITYVENSKESTNKLLE